MPDVQATGDSVPQVTSPPPWIGVALAGDAGAGEHERDELLRRAVLAGDPDRVGADEARVLLAAPAEAGLDRAAVSIRSLP